MDPEIFECSDARRTRVLRIDGPEQVEFLARADIQFDAVEVGPDIANFLAFAPYADRIQWLFACQAQSAEGLELLQAVERISFGSSDAGLNFDYRLLKGLKSFDCDGADKIPAKFLNSPSVERLNIASGKVESFEVLGAMINLRQARLSNCRVKSLAGIGGLKNLSELRLYLAGSLKSLESLENCLSLTALEIEGAKKLMDLSAIKSLKNLRFLAIDAPNAELEDVDWLTSMPELCCAAVRVRTSRLDWKALARHHSLYDLVVHSVRGGLEESDDELMVQLQSEGRKVQKLTRYKAVPAIRIEFEPIRNQQGVKPLPYYEKYFGRIPSA